MNNFFAAPTDVWGDNAVKLTAIGMAIIIAIILIAVAVALGTKYREKGSKTFTTKQLVFSAMAIALATVTSMLKVFELPMGGSITLCSMFFIVLIGYWYGPVVGIATGVAYGLLQFTLEPIFYTIPQMLTDYPLAFGALGLSGFFAGKKNGLTLGYIAGILGRFFFAFLSGWIFFGSYAPENMGAVVYSLAYNGSYIFAEAIITLIIINLPPVKSGLNAIRQNALRV